MLVRVVVVHPHLVTLIGDYRTTHVIHDNPLLLPRENGRPHHRMSDKKVLALAWLLAQGDDIAPIPGTKRVARVEENTAADRVELSVEQVERLNSLTPAVGERHEEAQMATIDR